MKTPERARSRLRRVVDTVEWYEWPIDAEKLHAQTGITLRSHSPLDRNIELKRELESMLFGMAKRCAAGLHAACRFSEPLSFTVVDG